MMARLVGFILFLALVAVPVQGENASPGVSGDQAVVCKVFQQLAQLVRLQPAPGHCFRIDADFSCEADNRSVAQGSASLVRGEGNRYQLWIHSDKIPVKSGQLRIGCDDAPWVVTADGSVFRGSLEPEGKSPVDFCDPKLRMYHNMSTLLLGLVAQGQTGMLSQFGSLRLAGDGSERRVELAMPGDDSVRLFLKPGGAEPEKLTWRMGNNTGTILFNRFSLDAPSDPGLFAPPKTDKTVAVSEQDLNRVLAAYVNFALEGGLEP